ncbi:MAG: hypothetical protein RIR70_1354, partial [Pseudomonadota bacterium]|jgi:(p)ppGpp synthase/HD superfamily hydrolase
MSTLPTAIALACRVHADQQDKAGQPYILHPLRVMLKLASEEEKIVGVLHDTVEDGDVSLEDLTRAGFSERVVAAIDCLTKRAGEPYDNFIARIAANDLARSVKIEDIKDNLDLTRLTALTDEDWARVAKYHRALAYLLSAS